MITAEHPMLATAWPFVGRERELARVARALRRRDTAGLVLSGPAGVGKTRLAAECATIAERVGFRCTRVLATRAAAGVPLGALSALLPSDAERPSRPGNWLGWAADAIARGSGPLLLVVDDAHLLDDASATVVQQLASSARAFVVVTMRAGVLPPDPLVALWKDDIVERFDLEPLGADAVDRLLDAVLPGAIDGALRLALWQASGGNALFLRELVHGASAAGILRHELGVWQLTRRLVSTPRLVELVEARLADLGRADRDMLELLALGEPLPWPVLARFADPGAVDALERLGLVTAEPRGTAGGLQVSLAHPLYGDVLRSDMTALGRMAASQRLSDAARDVGGGVVRDLQRAMWQLDGGGAVEPALMLGAAATARRAGDLETAERFVVAATEAGAGVAAGLLHARVLAERGRHDEAQALLGELVPLAGSDEQRIALAVERYRALLYWHGCGADAAEVLAAAAGTVSTGNRTQVQAHQAVCELMRGRLAEAVRVADELDVARPARGRATAAAAAAVASAIAGRRTAAAVYVERAGRGAEPGRGRLAQSVALCESGELARARAQVTEQYRRALRLHSQSGQAWFAMLRGRVALLTGELVMAQHSFAEGAAVAAQLGHVALRRWCVSGTALASAQRSGGGDRAAAAAQLLESLPQTDLHLLEPDVLRALAWTSQARGRPVQARHLLEEAVAVALAADAGALAAAAWHDLARLGAVDAAAPLVDFAAGTDNRLIAARAAHVAALAVGDPAELAVVATEFEAIGATLFAAEAAAAAAGAYRRRQHRQAADRLAASAHTLARKCTGDVATVALDLAGPAAELTAREHEVASLAGRGRSNKDIADALTLSVRTVETHLQRAYTKLAVSSRTDVPAALRGRE